MRPRVYVRHLQMARIREGLKGVVGDDLLQMDAAVLLVMAMTHGSQDIEHLTALTGFERDFVERVRDRMVKNRCWLDGKFAFEYEPGAPSFDVEFVLHVLIGIGLIKLTSS